MISVRESIRDSIAEEMRKDNRCFFNRRGGWRVSRCL